jgi:hypothetical protein
MVKYNFKIGDVVKTSKQPYNKNFGEGSGYIPNKILTIKNIDYYDNYIVAFFKEINNGIRYSETHPNFLLLNKTKTYELW